MTSKTYTVIVGNIGTIYYGHNQAAANREFAAYVRQSRDNSDKAAGESVDMYCDGEPVREYRPIGCWALEVTDMFSGEANYSWVHRDTASGKLSKRGIVRALKALMGHTGRKAQVWDAGDMVQVKVPSRCIVGFATWQD
jgi:hypothetical protein